MDHVCEHGSTCVDGVNEYICTCRPSYTGQYCDAGTLSLSF